MLKTILEIKQLNKTYPDGTQALKSIDLQLIEGDFTVIIGLSGAGKSSLLRCVNRLVEPDKGSTIRFLQHDVTRARSSELRIIRRQIGMIFQHYNLIKRSSTVQNVLHGRLGYMSSWRGGFGLFSKQDIEDALEILKRVGLEDQAYKRADELSGGQQQRVGIARAIAQRPTLIMADEPIASLDPTSSENVMQYLRKICKEDGITAIVNLHQVEFAKRFADRIIGIRKGGVVFDGKPEELESKAIAHIYNTEHPQTDAEQAEQELQISGIS